MTVLMERRRIGKTELSVRCGDWNSAIPSSLARKPRSCCVRTMCAKSERNWTHRYLVAQLLSPKCSGSYSKFPKETRSHWS